jgi:phosphatidylserine decarboxylase precursor-related protein
LLPNGSKPFLAYCHKPYLFLLYNNQERRTYIRMIIHQPSRKPLMPSVATDKARTATAKPTKPYFTSLPLNDRRLMISIFMSLWNVHANWFPVDGKVKFVKHENGKYMKAWLPKASEENEHADIMITTPEGVDVLCRQIAGAVARRIVTYAKEGEECYIDEHLGFIKLGSRVDVYLPIGTEVCVKMGQATIGDQTIIAKLK